MQVDKENQQHPSSSLKPSLPASGGSRSLGPLKPFTMGQKLSSQKTIAPVDPPRVFLQPSALPPLHPPQIPSRDHPLPLSREALPRLHDLQDNTTNHQASMKESQVDQSSFPSKEMPPHAQQVKHDDRPQQQMQSSNTPHQALNHQQGSINGQSRLPGIKVKKRKVLLTSMQYAPDTPEVSKATMHAPLHVGPVLPNPQQTRKPLAGEAAVDHEVAEYPCPTAAPAPIQEDHCKQSLAGVFDGFF